MVEIFFYYTPIAVFVFAAFLFSALALWRLFCWRKHDVDGYEHDMAFGLETQGHLRGLVHGLGEPPGGSWVINFFA